MVIFLKFLNTSYTIHTIASLVNGEAIGNTDLSICKPGRIEHVEPHDITFIVNKSYEHFLAECNHVCVLVPKNFTKQPTESQAFIYVDNPHAAFAKVIDLYYLEDSYEYGIHPSAIIASTAIIHPESTIQAGVVIENNCTVSKGAVIGYNCVLQSNTSIGVHTILFPSVVCYSDTVIGDNCRIHSGAVIGSDGFGYVEQKDGSFIKITHAGNVHIKNDVEIGANTTIDRAVLGSTLIENGVKLDNLIQIGHNVSIGEHSALAGQSAIAGSAHIGPRNRFGGQVGMIGHISTADKVIVYGQSGIGKTIDKPGVYFGSPTQDRMSEIRRLTASQQLPDLIKTIHVLQQKIEILEQKMIELS